MTNYIPEDYDIMEIVMNHIIARDYNIAPIEMDIDFSRVGDMAWANVIKQAESDAVNN